jgi:nicotinamide-nucleotide amidase
LKAAIVAIGTEVTEGRIANTNAAWISRRLLRLGVETTLHVAAPDDREEMRRAFEHAASRAGLVVVTGGLGPTVDDITREVAADLAGVPLEEDAASISWLEAIFARMGRALSENNRRQAQFPRGARVVANPHGTAPGFEMDLCSARFFFAPGVPHECEKMIEADLVPEIERRRAAAGEGAVVVRRLNCFGLAESKVDALLAPHFPGPEPALAFNISDGVVQVYLTSRAPSAEAAKATLDEAAAKVCATLGHACYGEGERSLEEATIDALRARGLTVATAESCTGGLAGSRIARVPGASDVFRGGVIAYANDVKRALLGVPAEILERDGAVSEACARAMAEGARRATGASLAVAITGIAGPTGATPTKPVGLVHLAVAGEGVARHREVKLPGDRARIQHLAAMGAIELVRRAALGLGDEHPRP